MIIATSGKIGSGKDTVGKIIQFLTAKDVGISFTTDMLLDSDLDMNQWVNTNWKVKKFADKLKDIVCLLIDCTRKDLENQTFKETELEEEWTNYAYAKGFWYHSDNNPAHKMMDSISCSKEKYEEENRINWQTAYKKILTPRLLLQLIGTECGRNIIHPNIWINSLFNEYKLDLNSTVEEDKRLLSIWKNMNTRCTNLNYEKYHKYGGKGITIYKEWKDFKIFKVWALSNGYTNDLTLDRKNTDGNYEPNNCRFVTSSLQAFNKNNYDGGTSNIKGVSLYSSTGKWQAQIQSKGKKQNLGYYNTEELAKQAYLKEYNKILLELEQETKLLQRNNYPNIIITDTRFKNELEAVKSRKGITIRVNRNNYPTERSDIKLTQRAETFLSNNFPEHESETALDNATFDYVIENDSDVQSLIEKVKIILEKEKII